ncbi:MAG: hypothetical protein H6742_03360 [Alphaproteobacteria bacterium]|nr:hypothetical protein [Alphaproteobacteria bacterium]
MNTLVYLVAAVSCIGFALRAWNGDRRDPARRAFVLLGTLLGLMYAGFMLYLLPGMGGVRYVQSTSAALLPAALMWFLDRLLGDPRAPASPTVRRMWVLSPLVAIGFVVTDSLFFFDVPRASPPEVALGVYSYAGLLLCMHRLWEEHERVDSRVEKARLRYMLFLLGAGLSFSLLEDIVRGVGPAPDLHAAALSVRASELQGALPPLGALFTTLFVYFLHQVVQLTRLLDLHEIFSRLFTLGVAGLLLVFIDGITVFWFGDLMTTNPAHGTFQIFLASVLFLALYDPLRQRIEALADQWFNRRGRRLELTLTEVDQNLARAISIDSLDQAMLGRLQASGRIPLASIYLRDPDTGLYRLRLRKGTTDQPLMRTISASPFGDAFLMGREAYVRSDLEQLIRWQAGGHEDAAARLRTMDAMDADVVVPFRSGEYLLGWLSIKDETWSDGFSRDEIRRLVATVDRATHVLENIDAVEHMKEQHRLAALGTMSAGLAHEIRNPLAGIKGAAQFLQGDVDESQVREFLSVIVDETDRLNNVVHQFLDYARPFEVDRSPTDLERLVRRVLDLVKVQDLPADVALRFEPAGDLLPAEVDADKLRQVLLNLVHNAVQAVSGPGRSGGTVIVRTGTTRLRDLAGTLVPAAELAVEDDGPGIAPEDMDKLFIPFFTTRSNGTGLGLPISRRLVEAHGGELLVRSKPGSGSIFLVRVPLHPEGDAETSPDSLPAQG